MPAAATTLCSIAPRCRKRPRRPVDGGTASGVVAACDAAAGRSGEAPDDAPPSEGDAASSGGRSAIRAIVLAHLAGGKDGRRRAAPLRSATARQPGAARSCRAPCPGDEMPNSLAARKRVRQNERRADRLRPFRTRASRAVRDAREAIADGAPEAAELVRAAQAALDSAARRNIIHANAASRRKSRLAQQLRRAATAD